MQVRVQPYILSTAWLINCDQLVIVFDTIA
jgi:hypothetical protein